MALLRLFFLLLLLVPYIVPSTSIGTGLKSNSSFDRVAQESGTSPSPLAEDDINRISNEGILQLNLLFNKTHKEGSAQSSHLYIKRPFWEQIIESAWKEQSLIWVLGIRGTGKETLCRNLDNVEYFDCASWTVQQKLNKGYEYFLFSSQGKRLILDRFHRLSKPSRIIATADRFPATKIIATGNSVLGASCNLEDLGIHHDIDMHHNDNFHTNGSQNNDAFQHNNGLQNSNGLQGHGILQNSDGSQNNGNIQSDALSRKPHTIMITPLLLQELKSFGNPDILYRFLVGGLPKFFLKGYISDDEYHKWLETYWTQDIFEIFPAKQHGAFLEFAQLLLAHSGEQYEARKYARECNVSQETIYAYRDHLENSFFIHMVRPYATDHHREIVQTPKVYAFDTGFVCKAKGWNTIRIEDTNLLWEHIVLNELYAHLQKRDIQYWHDRHIHEIDFVIQNPAQQTVTAIECKFQASHKEVGEVFERSRIAQNFKFFRARHPEGENFVVCHDIITPFPAKVGDLTIWFVNPETLVERVMITKNS